MSALPARPPISAPVQEGGGSVAVGAYTAVVWSMYTSMVKNFDMTIRRQSR